MPFYLKFAKKYSESYQISVTKTQVFGTSYRGSRDVNIYVMTGETEVIPYLYRRDNDFRRKKFAN